MSLQEYFGAYARSNGLRLPALPGADLVGRTPEYRHVAHQAARRQARVREFLAGRPVIPGRRLDSLDAAEKVDAAGKALSRYQIADREARVAEWAEFFGESLRRDGLPVRLDGTVPMAAEGLTSFFPTPYEVQHMNLPAWDGEILPIDRRVDPAAEDYVWWETDLVGVARAANSYDRTTIPMVAGPAAQANRGTIVPALVGMEVNFMDARRAALARDNRKPFFDVDRRKEEACRRALAEFFHFLWLFGDVTLGIDGLFNHPGVGAITIVGTWATKTPLQILADMNLIVNTIPNDTGGALGDRKRLKIMLPPAQYQAAAQAPVTASGDKSVLSFFLETWNLAPTQVVEVQQFAAANSQIYNGGPNGLAQDTGIVTYDRGNIDDNPSFVLSQDIEVPAPPHETGLSTVTYYHARGGGLRLPDARAIRRISGF